MSAITLLLTVITHISNKNKYAYIGVVNIDYYLKFGCNWSSNKGCITLNFSFQLS